LRLIFYSCSENSLKKRIMAKQNKTINNIINSSAVIFGGMIFCYGFSFLTKIILARHFGPEAYGMLNMALAVMVISSNIATAGMNMGVARYVAVFESKNEKDNLNKVIGSGNIFILTASLFVASLVFAASPWISIKLSRSDDLTMLVRYCSLIIPFWAFISYTHGVLRGYKDMVGITLSNDIVGWVFRITGIGVLILCGGEIVSIPLVYLISSWVIILTIIYFLGKHIKISCLFSTSPFSDIGRKLFQFSWPLSLSMITTMLRKRVDILIVGYFLAADQVGLYSAALPVASLPMVILYGVNRILLPVASQMFGDGDDANLKFVYSTMVRWCIVITLPIYFFIIIHSKFIILLLFGNKYVEANIALAIFAIGSFANVASGSFGEYFQAYGKTKFNLFVSMIGAVSNLILMYFLIPIFGINGGAFSVSLSLVMMCIAGICLLYKFMNILPFTKEYFKTLWVAVFTLSNMAWCYFPQFMQHQNIYLFLFTILSFVSYIYGLYRFNAFCEIDKTLFQSFCNKLKNKRFSK
jgi:O-antigen/teichoic acid export membrane protein